MKTICLLFFLSASFFAGTAAPDARDSTVVLDATSVQNLGMESVPAEPSVFMRTAFALGHLEIVPANRSFLSARVPGRAVEVRAHVGDLVKKGQVLARLESRQPGEPPPVLDLAAPGDGMVWESTLAVGQPVDPESALMEIVDLSSVLAVVKVPDAVLARLTPGAKARLTVPAVSAEPMEVAFQGIGPRADEAAGVVPVLFRLDNPGLRLRPGMRVEAILETGRRADVLSIPREALQGDGAARYVFIKHYDLPHAFSKVPVVLGETSGTQVEILKGLLPGDEVITRGAYALSYAGKGSVSLKEAMDAAHGHPHNEDGTEMSKEQQASGGAGDHDHEHDAGSPGRATFFAATSGILLVLLLLSLFLPRRRPE